jgi:putative tricarboxylic transport membrane protein
MWLGNLMLVIINLPMIGMWVRLLSVPYRILFPAILLFCCIGIYSINNSPADVLSAAFFGLAGYTLYKLSFEPAPLLLGFVLGRLMERQRWSVARQLHDLRRAPGVGRPAAGRRPGAVVATLPTMRQKRTKRSRRIEPTPERKHP